MKGNYVAILVPVDGGYAVRVPDLPSCVTSGTDLNDAMDMAHDALNACLLSLEDHQVDIPVPTHPDEIAWFEGELLAVIAHVEDEQRLLADVATVATAFPPELRPEVVSISAEAVDRIALALDGGRTVVWGSADQSDVKAEVIAALLAVEAKVYDVSAPGHPTTK